MVEPTPVAAPDVTIRAAGFADLPALRHLYRQFLGERPAAGYPVIDGDELDALVRTLAVQFTAQAPIFVVLGAWQADRPVAFLGLEIGERAVGRPHRVVNAHWLYVVPALRKLGIASRLMAAGLEWLGAHHPDITHVEWFAAAGDPQWSQRGFTAFLTRYQATLETFRQPYVPPVVVHEPAPEPTEDPAALIAANTVLQAVNGSPIKNGHRKGRTRQGRRTHAPRRSDAE